MVMLRLHSLTGYATKMTLRRVRRDRGLRDTATSKFHRMQDGAVRSKRGTDGLNSNSLGCAPTTSSDTEDYRDGRR